MEHLRRHDDLKYPFIKTTGISKQSKKKQNKQFDLFCSITKKKKEIKKVKKKKPSVVKLLNCFTMIKRNPSIF